MPATPRPARTVQPLAAAPYPVTLVLPDGAGSMDRCAQRLARELPVPTLPTDVYRRCVQGFGACGDGGHGSREAERRFVARLRAPRRALHIPNHHLARYARFVDHPYAITVHDLIRLFDLRGGRDVLIQRTGAAQRRGLLLDYAAIARADRVIAVSHATRRDVVEQLGVPAERVHVVPNGIDHERLFPVTRRLWSFPYVLFVGTEQPRKNLAGLLRAFARLAREPRFRDLRLVKVGGPGSDPAFRERTRAIAASLGLADRVVFSGRLDDADMAAAYSGAACLALPSLYEGFGLPCLEAMACGCPVVVSDAGALPEVGGDAALTVPAGDDRELAAALREAMEPATARELIARGLARARAFTWSRAARSTLEVYSALAAGAEAAA